MERNQKDPSRNKWKRNERIVKINKTKSWFFEKINKIDKSLARLIKKKEKHQIYSLILHLTKQLEKEEQKNPPKISRRKEIIKIWAEINEKEMKETIVKINKTESCFSEKINKIDKPLVRLIRKKKEKNQQN